MSINNVRSKYWVFTINNYTADELAVVDGLVESDCAAYLCRGLERGEQGTPHIQGYVEFNSKKRGSAVKKIFPRAHLAKRAEKATGEDNREYCSKEGEFAEFGAMSAPAQGNRTDLQEIKKALDEGKPEVDIAENHFGSWVRYRKSFEAYRQLKRPKTSRDIKVYVLWGESRTGKTRYVFEHEPDLFISPDPTLRWFDGYQGQAAVLLDDYGGDGNFEFMLRLLDRYPLKVPVKGGFVDWIPERIYLTANCAPPFGHPDVKGALVNRVTKSIRLSSKVNFENREEVDYITNYLQE